MYVGNIPFSAGEDELRELFTPFGEVESVHVVTDRATADHVDLRSWKW
ncbi:MAG: hypothetical protein CM1200mP25_1730 [Acidobacteriota bacterium]|nr:MAG: hypothetical protein CM1200mP25_1730 [Acidobacteriota bacterium]